VAEDTGADVRALFANASVGEIAGSPEGSDTQGTKDQTGKDTGAPGGAKEDKPVPEPKPESGKGSLPKADATAEKPAPDAANKSKFAKERERREKSWSEINAEKEAFKAEKQALETEREAFRKECEASEARLKRAAEAAERDEHGYSASDYERASEQFQKDGDTEMAGMAAQAARALKAKSEENVRRSRVEQFQNAWRDNLSNAEEKEPDLKDPQSELHKEVLSVLNGFPLLQHVPDGVLKALEAVKVQRRAAQADKHEAEAGRLRSELESLQKKLSVNGGTPSEPLAEEKPFDSLPLEEQRRRLRAEFARAGAEA